MRLSKTKIAIGSFLFVSVLTLLLTVITWCFWEPFYIPSSSMQPTLLPGDLVWVHKQIATENLKAGDVIVFEDAGTPHIKRIIGIAGDRVRLKGEVVFINDVVLSQVAYEFDRRASPTSCDVRLKVTAEQAHLGDLPTLPYTQGYKNFSYFIEHHGEKNYWIAFDHKKHLQDDGEWVVPENAFFVMGDNRTNSIDSRQHGFVQAQDVLGKAESIWFSVTNKQYACGPQPFAWLQLYLRSTRGGQKL